MTSSSSFSTPSGVTVTFPLSIANGGNNSSSALSGSSIMVSNGSAVIQGSAGTSTTVLHGNASGIPTYSAVSLTNDTTGTLPISKGGTNSNTALSGSTLMVSNGSAVIQGSAGTSTTVLHGNAAGVPTYSAVSLTADVTGTLPVANGGSGRSTLTSNAILTGNGTSAVGQLAPVNDAVVSYTGAGVLQATTTLPSAVQSNITSVGTVSSGTWSGTAIGTAKGGTNITSYTLGDILYCSAPNTLSKLAMGSGVLCAGLTPSWGSVALNSATSGTLSVIQGGTGQTTLTSNAILTGNGTSAVGQLTPVNNAVVSYTGAGALQATTTLPSAVQSNITQVGTIGSGTWQGTPISSGSGGTGFTGTMLNGVLPIGNGSTFTKANLTPGTNIAITNGAGSITIATSLLEWVIRDEKTAGTNGGGTTAGSTLQRDLTILKYNPFSSSDVTLSSNDFTLVAGTWEITVSAPAYNCGLHRCELYSVTLSGVVSYGTSEIAGTGVQSRSQLTFLTQNAGSQTYRVRHWAQNTQATNGYGIAHSNATETYITVNIRRLA